MNLRRSRIRRTMRHTLTLVICLLMGGGTGCGRSGAGGKLYPVSGKVLVGDVPIKQGGVRFQPDRSRGNTVPYEPVAKIQEDGTYALYTNGKRGAPEGWYKVSVSGGASIDSSKPFTTKSPVPQRFTNPETAGLEVEVRSTTSAADYDLRLSPR
jgi:hypothetical protein